MPTLSLLLRPFFLDTEKPKALVVGRFSILCTYSEMNQIPASRMGRCLLRTCALSSSPSLEYHPPVFLPFFLPYILTQKPPSPAGHTKLGLYSQLLYRSQIPTLRFATNRISSLIILSPSRNSLCLALNEGAESSCHVFSLLIARIIGWNCKFTI